MKTLTSFRLTSLAVLATALFASGGIARANDRSSATNYVTERARPVERVPARPVFGREPAYCPPARAYAPAPIKVVAHPARVDDHRGFWSFWRW